jgi:hypothetical protein
MNNLLISDPTPEQIAAYFAECYMESIGKPLPIDDSDLVAALEYKLVMEIHVAAQRALRNTSLRQGKEFKRRLRLEKAENTVARLEALGADLKDQAFRRAKADLEKLRTAPIDRKALARLWESTLDRDMKKRLGKIPTVAYRDWRSGRSYKKDDCPTTRAIVALICKDLRLNLADVPRLAL